jgi:UDPglucose 6-dehydrogenase
MNITIIGSGYVGLVTGACLADVGNNVLCYDTDHRKTEMLTQGEIPIFEPGLKELVTANLNAGRLRFTSSAMRSVEHGAVQFIAVGTPPTEDGSADLNYVLAATDTIGRLMQGPKIVVTKSTVPVGTSSKVRSTLANALKVRDIKFNFSVVSNPEFLKEGAAIADFMRPDRIVIGADDPWAVEVMRQIYAPFERNRSKLLVMDINSAELTKYAANAMLATRISFMNEMALLAERVGADIDNIRRGIGSDPRIGSDFLYAGCGYGGSCFPKDVKAVLRTAAEVGLPMNVIDAVEKANQRQKSILAERLEKIFGGDLTDRRIAIWGLAFKPNTDDMREAPSIPLINNLLSRNAEIAAYDPVAETEAKKYLENHPNLNFYPTSMGAATGADALVIVTEWKEFRSTDLSKLNKIMKKSILVDGRNIIDPNLARQSGFEYIGIGRS